MAGCIEFKIDIKSSNYSDNDNHSHSHNHDPKGTTDVIMAASQLILQFHTIVSRNISPLDEGVITVATFKAGDNSDTIAKTARLTGTMRWFDPNIKKLMDKRISGIINGISKSFNVKINIEWEDEENIATINDKKCAKIVEKAAIKVLPKGVIRIDPTMAAEDFAYFLKHRPGCFFFVGCGVTDENDDERIYPHHKPDFKVDEKCLMVGVQIFVNLILDLLKPKSCASGQNLKCAKMLKIEL